MSIHYRKCHSRSPLPTSSSSSQRFLMSPIPEFFYMVLIASILASILLILSVIHSPSTTNNFQDQSTITKGSSLYASPNKTNYLLSPSGKFAFGFKSLGKESEKYKIGIWIVNSTEETLVWVPNPRNDEPVERDSSILISGEGLGFVIRKPGFVDEKLMNNIFPGLVSYGIIQDSGNFVVYNNEKRIVWQSFDYPTDTIVQGQTLKFGGRLESKIGGYSLEMEEQGDLVVKRTFRHGNFVWYYHWRSNTGNAGSQVELKLDGDGRLHVVDWDLRVIRNFTDGEGSSAGESVYRATMYSDGYFRLYKESISSEEAQKSVLLWQSGCIPCDIEHERALEMQQSLIIFMSCIVLMVGCFVAICYFG